MGANRGHRGTVEELKGVLAAHPGSTEVHLRLEPAGSVGAHDRLTDAYRVNATEALFGDLKVILGPRCLVG